jgi:hypothetical protein
MRTDRPALVLVAVHFFSRMHREGQRSPMPFRVIAFHPNTPEANMFTAFTIGTNGMLHPSRLMKTSLPTYKRGRDVPINPAHVTQFNMVA